MPKLAGSKQKKNAAEILKQDLKGKSALDWLPKCMLDSINGYISAES